MLDQNLFKAYADIKNQIKTLEKEAEEKLAELKPLIIEEMRAIESDRIDTKVGQFLLKKGKTTWKYSPAIDALKTKEEEEGIATCKKGEDYLAFNPNNTQKVDNQD